MAFRNIALYVLAGLAACSPLRADAGTTLLVNSYLAANDVFNVGIMRPWATEVEKATNGAVKFEFSPTSLAAPQQQMDSVIKGVFDVSYMFNGFLPNRLPLLQLVQIPFVVPTSASAESMSIGFWRVYQQYFTRAHEFADVHLLALFAFPCDNLYSMKGPLTSVEQLHGIKIWAVPGNVQDLMQRTGAAVISTPGIRMPELISGGQVDAFVGIQDIYAQKFNVVQYAKSQTDFTQCLATGGFSLFMNKQKWAALPKNDQMALQSLSGEAFARRLEVLDRANDRAHSDAKRAGLKIIAAPPAFAERLKELAAPIEAKWVKTAQSLDVDGKAAIESYRNAIREAR